MPAVDQFKGLNTVENYSSAEAVTPDDVTELAFVSRALFFNATAAASAFTALMADGTTATFSGLPAGTYFWPLRVRRINSTGLTPVANIVALR